MWTLVQRETLKPPRVEGGEELPGHLQHWLLMVVPVNNAACKCHPCPVQAVQSREEWKAELTLRRLGSLYNSMC